VPIIQKDGKWSFDSSMGVTAMKARRIGADETDAIEICAGFVGAEQRYAEQQQMHQYAPRIADLQGLVPPEFIAAANTPPRPYHGYYFQTVIAQGPDAAGGQSNYMVKNMMIGGFALVAWPAEYGVTGVHTFIV